MYICNRRIPLSTTMITASDITATLLAMRDDRQRDILSRFFKTGKGDYGEGDRFLGIKVPQTRAVVKQARLQVPLDEIQHLVSSEWHEVRLCGFLLAVEEIQASLPRRGIDTADKARRRTEIARFYLRNARHADNWDLVDLSCPKILGTWLLHLPPEATATVLDPLAHSDNLWEQRIAIVTTLTLIRNDRFADTLRIADILLTHPHDLIHKAVGWMLREVGKRSTPTLETYLATRHSTMHRTTLRYAIERLPAPRRLYWMQLK